MIDAWIWVAAGAMCLIVAVSARAADVNPGDPNAGPLTLPAQKPLGPAWARNLPIYEVDLARQTREGTFAAFQEKRLPQLKALGVGIVWFMPLHPCGGNPPGKPKSQSCYCVRDYYDVHPRFGTKEDFRKLVKAIHQAGMYVLMDWVPNHTSWGNRLVTEHPEFYAKDKDGKIRAPAPWPDVAQLDYANRDLWTYMYEARKYWLTEFDVDGFREDVAGALPIEHWKWLRAKLNAVKPVFMLAEAQGPKLLPAFDMDYDWDFQPVFWKISHFHKPVGLIDQMLANVRKAYPAGAVRMRHLTNHDMTYLGYAWDNRPQIDIKFLETVGLTEKYAGGQRPAAVLCATLPGGKPLIWTGQEIGILDHTPCPVRWTSSPEIDFYARLMKLYRDHKAVWGGDFLRVPCRPARTGYAFLRRSGKQRVLVVLNLSAKAGKVTLAGDDGAGDWTEVFTDRPETLAPKAGLDLDAWGYRVYTSR